MTNRKPTNKKNETNTGRKEKAFVIDDTPIDRKQRNPIAVMRFAAKLPPAQRKKFLDKFNTLYIEEE
jgi:hypothetical protein